MKATDKKTASLLKGKRIARYAAQVADDQPITFHPYTLQQIELLERDHGQFNLTAPSYLTDDLNDAITNG